MQDLKQYSLSTPNGEDLLMDIHEPPELEQRNGLPYIRALFQRKYPWPVDPAERLRQEEEHTSLFAHFEGRLYHAPCDPKTVLAIGDVYGYWSIDFAESSPSSKVYCFDSVNLPPKAYERISLLCTMLTYASAPENILFDDDHRNWHRRYKNIDFAYVSRMGHRVQNLDDLLDGIARCCKRRAWVEFVDWAIVIQTDRDCAIRRWYKAIKAALDMYGYNIDLPIRYYDKIMEKGFWNITPRNYHIPMSIKDSAHTETSKQVLQRWLDGIEAFSLEPITAKLLYSAEEVRELCRSVRREIFEGGIDIYLNWRVLYGQTPVLLPKNLTPNPANGPDQKDVLDPLSLSKIISCPKTTQWKRRRGHRRNMASFMECTPKLLDAADDENDGRSGDGESLFKRSHYQLDIIDERAARRKSKNNSTNLVARKSQRRITLAA